MNLACNLACLCLAAGLVSSRAELIPADRLVNWTPGQTVGVVGGIPIRSTTVDVTQSPYNVDSTGVSEASTGIQSAINAAASNTVIYLPAGTYKFAAAGVSVKTGVTLRGAGMSNTVINFTVAAGEAIHVGSDVNFAWSWPVAPDDVLVSGYTKGSSNVVLTLTTDASWVGQQVLFREALADTNLPVVSVSNYGMSRGHSAIITAQAGTSITFWPPLTYTMQASLNPKYNVGQFAVKQSGVEDLRVNCAGSTSTRGAVTIEEGWACWIKNVKVSNCKNYAFAFGDAVSSEIRGSWANQSQDGPVSNHAGLLFGRSFGCLVEDDIFEDIFPAIEINAGAAGNAFFANFLPVSYFGGAFNVNHSPHNHHNLFEGNVSLMFQSDGYFGSSSEDMFFRNWAHGIYTGVTNGAYTGVITDEQASGIMPIKLNRFARNETVIGNVIGNTVSNINFFGQISGGKPNIGNEDWNGNYGPPWTYTTKDSGAITINISGKTGTASAPIFDGTNVNWTMLTKESFTGTGRGYITSVTSSTIVELSASGTVTGQLFSIASGPSGWQELDTNVMATAIFKDNYYHPVESPRVPLTVDPIANPTNPDVSLGGDTVPISLLYTNRPSWLAVEYSWPLINKTNPPTGLLQSNLIIPSMARFFGEAGGGGGGATNPPIILQGGVILKGAVNLGVRPQ